MTARRATEAERERWLELRAELRPEMALERQDTAIGRVLAGGTKRAAFVFQTGAAPASGLIEVARDSDDGSFARVEALYVAPGSRRRGQARVLLDAASGWAASAGCRELRCSWPLEDAAAHAGLAALGFAESSREVLYSRTLHPAMALGGELTGAAGVTSARRPPAPPAGERSSAARLLLHGSIVGAGVVSLLMTDIFSGDLLRGALLPLLDLLFILYVLAMVAGLQYRRRTDSSERSVRLFDAAPPSRDREGME